MLKERFALLGVAGVSALATIGWMRQGQIAPVPAATNTYQPAAGAVYGPSVQPAAIEPAPAADGDLTPAPAAVVAPAETRVRVVPQVRYRSGGAAAARQRDQVADRPSGQPDQARSDYPQNSGPAATSSDETPAVDETPRVDEARQEAGRPETSRREEPTQTASRRAPIVYDDRGVSTAPVVKERSTKTSAAIIAGGAAVGAAIGAIAGRGKGAMIGAASGAGAGLIYDRMTRRRGVVSGPAGNGTLGGFYPGQGRSLGSSAGITRGSATSDYMYERLTRSH